LFNTVEKLIDNYELEHGIIRDPITPEKIGSDQQQPTTKPDKAERNHPYS
jgi:hypothetical protein